MEIKSGPKNSKGSRVRTYYIIQVCVLFMRTCSRCRILLNDILYISKVRVQPWRYNLSYQWGKTAVPLSCNVSYSEASSKKVDQFYQVRKERMTRVPTPNISFAVEYLWLFCIVFFSHMLVHKLGFYKQPELHMLQWQIHVSKRTVEQMNWIKQSQTTKYTIHTCDKDELCAGLSFKRVYLSVLSS